MSFTYFYQHQGGLTPQGNRGQGKPVETWRWLSSGGLPWSLVETGRCFSGTYCLHHMDDDRLDKGGRNHLWNVRQSLRDYMARQLKRQLATFTLAAARTLNITYLLHHLQSFTACHPKRHVKIRSKLYLPWQEQYASPLAWEASSLDLGSNRDSPQFPAASRGTGHCNET